MRIMLVQTPPAAEMSFADNNSIIVEMNDKELSDLVKNTRPKEMISLDSKKVRIILITLYLHDRHYFLSFTPLE